MRFIIDESTGSAVAQYLISEGHDVLIVAETMPRASDREVLARAVRSKPVLITNDKDFGELVFRSGRRHSGVLLLRLQNDRPLIRVRVTKAVLEQYGEQLVGRFAVASEREVRFRPLLHPIEKEAPGGES